MNKAGVILLTALLCGTLLGPARALHVQLDHVPVPGSAPTHPHDAGSHACAVCQLLNHARALPQILLQVPTCGARPSGLLRIVGERAPQAPVAAAPRNRGPPPPLS